MSYDLRRSALHGLVFIGSATPCCAPHRRSCETQQKAMDADNSPLRSDAPSVPPAASAAGCRRTRSKGRAVSARLACALAARVAHCPPAAAEVAERALLAVNSAMPAHAPPTLLGTVAQLAGGTKVRPADVRSTLRCVLAPKLRCRPALLSTWRGTHRALFVRARREAGTRWQQVRHTGAHGCAVGP